MSKNSRERPHATPAKPKATRGEGERVTLGRNGFAKISAVEGIHLTAEMERDFREFDRKGLSPEERRRLITAKYGKKPA